MRTFFTAGLTGMLAQTAASGAPRQDSGAVRQAKLSRQDLGPQIHAISDETHYQIERLLTEHQKQLAKAMVERMHHGEENRRPAPSAGSK
jgi:hypothetical protein